MSLRVVNISFSYYHGITILRDINLDIQQGEVTAIFGPNGSGKSTLLRCVNGALRPQQGYIELDHKKISELSPREIAKLIAVVPQETPLNAPFTVREIVMMGRFARWNFWGEETEDDHTAVEESLKRVGAFHLIDRHFDELSGGERQRVIIARALAQQTNVLLLDEPASHLDIAYQLEIYRLVKQLASKGYIILMVCHDIVLAPMFADKAVLLKNGSVYGYGAPESVLTKENLSAVFGVDVAIEKASPDSLKISLPV